MNLSDEQLGKLLVAQLLEQHTPKKKKKKKKKAVSRAKSRTRARNANPVFAALVYAFLAAILLMIVSYWFGFDLSFIKPQ